MDVWERIAAVIHRLGDFDDVVVGKALEEIDAILEVEKLSWFTVADRLRAPPPPVSNYRAGAKDAPPAPVRRQPSQWLTDKADVVKAYGVREEADDWTSEFIESLYDQVVHKGFKLSEKQRLILDEKMDKLGV